MNTDNMMIQLDSLKWEIVIAKQAGLFRPKIVINIENTNKQNVLNIQEKYKFPYYRQHAWDSKALCCTVSQELHSAPILPDGLIFYTSQDTNNMSCEVSQQCFKAYVIGGMMLHFFTSITYYFYPEWHEGQYDYMEYIEFLRDNFCLPAVEEYNKRVTIALNSTEIPETKYGPDDFSNKKKRELKFRALRYLEENEKEEK